MPFDAPVVAGLTKEIQALLPLKIDKIHQPFADEFIFSCYGMGASPKLLISLNSRFSRFHLFEGNRSNPLNPSSFCMLLRKHFGGAKLLQIEAVPFERIVKLTFEAYDEITGLSKKLIWLELTGRSANLIVTTENSLIIDCWRRLTAKTPNERDLIAGATYELPSTKGRWQPVTLDLTGFTTLINQIPAGVELEKFLLKHWYGLAPLSILEFTQATGLNPQTFCTDLSEADCQNLYQSFQNWADTIKSGLFTPTILTNATGKITDYSALKVDHPPHNIYVKQVNSLNQAVASLLDQKQTEERFQTAQQNLLRKVSLLLEKNRTKLAKQTEEAQQAEKGDQWRIYGELVTSNGYQITKGSKTVNLINYYTTDAAEITIPLNPALSAQENAQAYFKKYQKAKKGQLAIATQITKTQETIDYYESVETLVENALNPADLQLIEEELAQNNSRQIKKPVKNGKKALPAEPRQFTTPAGHQLLVGRNNIQNDKLTFKIAAPGDLWFHTQKIPGSHVILKANPGIEIDDETLNYACQLAVYFSKAQKSTKVPVDYTQRKNVKKPPGANPGFVIYDFFKSAIITPDPEILRKLGLGEEV